MSVHTPGPWQARLNRLKTKVFIDTHYDGVKETEIAVVWFPPDANLIAAAPDLLAACEAIRRLIPADWPSGQIHLSIAERHQLRDAIAKAVAP